MLVIWNPISNFSKTKSNLLREGFRWLRIYHPIWRKHIRYVISDFLNEVNPVIIITQYCQMVFFTARGLFLHIININVVLDQWIVNLPGRGLKVQVCTMTFKSKDHLNIHWRLRNCKHVLIIFWPPQEDSKYQKSHCAHLQV